MYKPWGRFFQILCASQKVRTLWNAQSTTLSNLLFGPHQILKVWYKFTVLNFFHVANFEIYSFRLYEFIIFQKILDLFTFWSIRRHYWESELWNSKSAIWKCLKFEDLKWTKIFNEIQFFHGNLIFLLVFSFL